MSLWSFLFGGTGGAAPQRVGPLRLAGDGSFETEAVGESFYQGALEDICGGRCEEGHERECIAQLIPDPANPHDRNAVKVVIDGRHVAHLSREEAVDFHRDMATLGARGQAASCDAIINGGWERPRKNGSVSTGGFGVELDLIWPLQRG